MVNTTLEYARPENVTGASDFFINYTSTITMGWWGYGILLAVFSISYLSLSTYNPRKAFAASSFTTFVSTVILSAFGVVGGYVFTLTALMVVASILINQDGSGGVGV